MLNTTINKLTITIQIRNKRNRGGYDLYYNIDGNDILISKDFSAGDFLILDIPYDNTPLNKLTQSIRNSYIYSKAQDTWACDSISVHCTDSNSGLWVWVNQTAHIERNSKNGGKDDNPVLFFLFDWTVRDPNPFNNTLTYGPNWMQDHLNEIGHRPLSMICMPGTHDSGMSESTSQTFGATNCNTITQRVNIYNQLKYGVRFFDIRPVIGSGNYYTGHYSNVGYGLDTQGARGQSIDSIIENINQFTSNHQELIILDLSHAKNTDKKNNDGYYPKFTDNEWAELFKKFQSLNYLLNLTESDHPIDFRKTPLNYFVNGKSCVIIIVDELNSDQLKKIGYFKKGIYPVSENWFDHYDEYSDTNVHDKMAYSEEIKDGDPIGQIPKLTKYGASKYFLLSWTLTQSAKQAVGCGIDPTGLTKSILQLADNARDNYEMELKPFITGSIYPNIISMDGVNDNSITYLCMYINSIVTADKKW